MATGDLRAEISVLRKEVEKLGDLVELLVEDEGETSWSGSGGANGSSRVRKTLDAARRYGKRAIDGVQSGIEDQPWIGVAVALALGVVVGRLLAANRD